MQAKSSVPEVHKPRKNLRRRGCECNHCAELREAAIARRDVLWLKAICESEGQ